MNIPSTRTRHDMEIAAELRAQGATWATIGLQLKRQPGLLQRPSRRVWCEFPTSLRA